MVGRIDSLIGTTIEDPQGHSIGKINQIFLDDKTEQPSWVSVSTGFFSSDSLVPLAGAKVAGDHLQVPVSKDRVKSAPHLASGQEISPDAQRELYSHYGIAPDRRTSDTERNGGQTHSGQTDKTTHDKTAQQYAAEPTKGQTNETGEITMPGQTTTAGEGTVAGHDRDHQAGGRHDEGLIRSEEHLNVDTQRQEFGVARLRKYVVTENESVTVPVTREEVRVEREPIREGEHVGRADIGEDVQEVTLHRDEVRVTKEAVPVERVRLSTDEVQDERTVSDTVRKERIETEGTEHSRHSTERER